MYIVVAGAGEVGLQVSEALQAEKHEVVLVDVDAAHLGRARHLDVLTVEGNAASPRVLEKAGIQRADLFFAVTDRDEVNLLACALAKRYGPRTIARINNLDFTSHALTEEYKDLGVDLAVAPELVAAVKIARLLDIPSILDMDIFAEGKVRVVECVVKPGSKVVATRLRELKLPEGILIVAIFREARILIPGGDDILRPGDRLLITIPDEDALDDLEPLFEPKGRGTPDRPIHKVLVVGATRMGVQLARILRDRGKEVTLLEEDSARSRDASEQLERVSVMQGNATDVDVLNEVGIETIDAVISAARLEEFNVLTCLLAKQYGVVKVVALINQPELRLLLEEIGIDIAVDPRASVVGELLRHTHTTEVESLALLREGEAQVLTLPVAPESAIAGKLVAEAGLPKRAVIAAIVRGESTLIPRGTTRIEPGDRLVVFTLTDVAAKLEKLF